MKTILLLLTHVLSSGFREGDVPKPVARTALSITFTVRNAGLDVTGQLTGQEVAIRFNPDNLQNSSIKATANVATINTGIAIRDQHLQQGDYFDAANHPRINLSSTSFRKVGKNRFTGRFDLTLKGITKEVSIPFTVTRLRYTTGYNGHFTVNRLDFSVGESSPILDQNVTVYVHLQVW